MTDLLREIESLIRAGHTYLDAPTIGEEVLDLIDAFLARFLGYSEEYRHTQLLWMAQTWLTDYWPRSPRLLFVSPEPNSGKTTALEIIQHFVPRAELVSNLTDAAFYQAIEDAVKDKGGRPTILHDQLDKLFGNIEYGRIRSGKVENLIETGFNRRGVIKRKMGKHSVPFNVFAAVALAGTMDLSFVPDAIRSRSLIIRMQRALPGEVPERWDERRHGAEADALCGLLQYWVEFIDSQAREHWPDIPEELSNRNADKWEPLFVMAELAGGRWPELARVTAVTAVTASANVEPSEGMRLLWATKAIFKRLGGNRIVGTDLVAELDQTGEFAWTRWTAQRAGIRMATILRAYGIHRVSFRDGPKSYWGYEWSAFLNAWLRYPPPSGDSGDSGDNEEGNE